MKTAPKLVYFVLEKELLLKFSDRRPDPRNTGAGGRSDDCVDKKNYAKKNEKMTK